MNRDYFKLRNIEYKVSTIRIYNYSKIKWMQEIYFLSVKKMPKVLFNMNEFNVIKNENNFIEVDSQQWYEFMYYLSSIFRDSYDKRKIVIENINHYLSIVEKDMMELTKEYSKNKEITNKSFLKIINDFVNVDVFSIFNMVIPYNILEKELKKLNLDIDIDNTYLCAIKPHRDIIKDEKIKLAIKLINNELSEEDLEKIDMLLLESHILDGETRETIVKLYEKGYYLGIISNNSIRNVEYILKREDIRKYFKKVVISEEVKERKPNLKVYMKAFEEIPKEEYNKIAFVSDELLEDLLGVKVLGVKTI